LDAKAQGPFYAAARHPRNGISAKDSSGAEHDGVHDPPGQQHEQPGDHRGSREQHDHDQSMNRDTMGVRFPDREREASTA